MAAAGADYIGVILAARGPRQQTIESAREIFAAAPEQIRVGVFADQPAEEVAATADALDLDIIQLHGSETASYVHELEAACDRAVWKAFSTTSTNELERAIDEFADDIEGLLLDARTGGSGERFDWSLAADARTLLPDGIALIVAGGLTPENVGDAIAALHPDIVDVASGVESEPGIKDWAKVRAFIENAMK